MRFRTASKVLAGVAVLALAGAVTAGPTGLAAPLLSPQVDISGPCDEAEHAADPGCQGNRAVQENLRGDDRFLQVVPDISGPCDEAEHANHPRCTGAKMVKDDDAATGSVSGPVRSSTGDVSGPCDEAEHVNDPECNGATPAPVRDVHEHEHEAEHEHGAEHEGEGAREHGDRDDDDHDDHDDPDDHDDHGDDHDDPDGHDDD